MNKFLGIFFLVLFLILIISIIYSVYCNFPEPQNLRYPFLDRKTLNQLTLEQKIGQLFIIGFDGKVLNSEIEHLVKELHPAGILLLKRNIENQAQLKELIDSLQRIALEDTGLPLFIAVDQEGGLISRIEWIEKTAQSGIETIDQAYIIGQNKGKELKDLGINLNLAPLLDATWPKDFIFERSFQKDIEKTGEMAKALIQGQKEAGILSAMKHFPGYGGISFNPEEKLAYLDKVPETLQFQEAAEAFPEMIMVSNIVYKDLDQKLPYAFLEQGVQFLKDKIKGNYLIISDDLSQNSLLDKFSLKEIVSLPIEAGLDVLIFSGWRVSADKGVLAFRQAVENKEVSEQRINQSVLKVIKLKQRLLK